MSGPPKFIVEQPDDWRSGAACRNEDPELFFARDGEGPNSDSLRKRVRLAKAVCKQCEVTSECLQYALKHDQRIGVWGGMTEDERVALKRSGSRRMGATALQQ
jgi:WhiB family transcriptional regulator, redox-sensing transcriptional regulator